VEVARVSAEAALRSAIAVELTQKAYVVFDTWITLPQRHVVNSTSSIVAYEFRCRWKNVGYIAARKVRVMNRLELIPSDNIKQVVEIDYFKTPFDMGVMGRDQSESFFATRISVDTAMKIFNKEILAIIFSKAWYFNGIDAEEVTAEETCSRMVFVDDPRKSAGAVGTHNAPIQFLGFHNFRSVEVPREEWERMHPGAHDPEDYGDGKPIDKGA